MRQLIDAVRAGNARQATALTEALLAEGHEPTAILNEGLITAMGVVGEAFGCGEIYVPEMLIAARAMQSALALLEPLISSSDLGSEGTVVIGTVKGDVHDIGKNIVAIMLKGSGFTVHDIGVDVAPERFVEAVGEFNPDVVAISALLTTTMTNMAAVIEALETAGARSGLKVMVGGAPVTDEFARSIGADGYGSEAAQAAKQAKLLLHSG